MPRTSTAFGRAVGAHAPRPALGFWRRVLLAGFLVLATLAAGAPAQADGWRRVALIVGNKEYKIWPVLNNSVADAELIKARLLAVGFAEGDIVMSRNSDMAQLTADMRKFSEMARGANLVLVYYTGHGAKYGPTNWIIPTDAPSSGALKTANASNYAIPVDRLVSVAGEGEVGIVLIDACRENTEGATDAAGGGAKGAPSLGMSTQDLPVPRGVLVQTSTQDGKLAYEGTGPHSLYAIAIDTHFAESGKNMRDILKEVEEDVAKSSEPKQRPTLIEDKLNGDIWVSLNGSKPPADWKPQRTPQDDAVAADEAQWRFVRTQDTIEGYETYRKMTPGGRHIADAEAAIARLKGAPPAVPAAPSGPVFAGTLDEARRALAAISDTEWRSDFPQLLAMKVLSRTNGAGVKALAETGNDQATVILAALYELGGGGLAKDPDQAKQLYQRAASRNNPIAHRVLGEFLRLGHNGEPPRPAEAVKEFGLAAAVGDATSLDRLGSLYAAGVEGEAGKKKAVPAFEKAAQQNDPWAQCHLAAIYTTGALGKKANAKNAVAFAQSSAEQHNACGQMILGHMYLYGENGLTKDIDRGAALYQGAAEQGYPEALTSLGLLYQSGEGIPRDIPAAIRHFRRAADQGYAPAQYLLGALYASNADGAPRDLNLAVQYFRSAAVQNYPSAQAALGWAYADGLGGLGRDETEAVRLFQLAANAKDPDGEFRLALMLASGRGAPKNIALASNLMKASSSQGYAAAQHWLDTHR